MRSTAWLVEHVSAPQAVLVFVVGVVALALAVSTMFVAPASPEPQPVQNLSTHEAGNGECVLRTTVDPGALADSDRLVVEVDGRAVLFAERTEHQRGGIVKGSNVTIYGVELPHGSNEGGVEVLLDGHLGPECQLVGEGPA